MSDIVDRNERGQEILPQRFSEQLRRQLGELADWAMHLAEGGELEPAATLTGLRSFRHGLDTTIDALEKQLLARPNNAGPSAELPTPEEMHAALLPDTWFEYAEDQLPEDPLYLYIVGDRHLYSPDTGHTARLGASLYLMNALLLTKDTPQPYAKHISYGFGSSRSGGDDRHESRATNTRFRQHRRQLSVVLSGILPDEDGLEPIVETGVGSDIKRMLNTRIVVIDKRHDQDLINGLVRSHTPTEPETPPKVENSEQLPAPAAQVPDQSEALQPEPPLIGRENTVEAIMHYLTHHGLPATEATVLQAAADCGNIFPTYDQAAGQDIYSFTAARRIIHWHDGPTPDFPD